MKWREVSEVRGGEVKWSEVKQAKWSEVKWSDAKWTGRAAERQSENETATPASGRDQKSIDFNKVR